jgi:hypothetical protein
MAIPLVAEAEADNCGKGYTVGGVGRGGYIVLAATLPGMTLVMVTKVEGM